MTVARKFGLSCDYIFHSIYPTRRNWQIILSQTKIFNIFLGSVQTSIMKILSSFCSRYKHNYISNRDFWINQLYFEISNSSKKQCLKIDIRDVNDLRAAKCRTRADNNKEQICYYNRNKRDKSFNSFLTMRKQTSLASEILFSIVKLIDKTNENSCIYFETDNELSDFRNDSAQYKRSIQWISESGIVRKKQTQTENTNIILEQMIHESAKRPVSFRIISHQKKQRENIQPRGFSRETVYRI